MKIFATLLISLSFCLHSFGQEKLTFENIIKTDSVGKARIYAELINWISENYKSPEQVIQISDKENGIINLRGIIEYSPKKITHLCYGGFISYAILFHIKENRFKVELTNFTHSVKPGNSQSCELGLITKADVVSEKGIQKAANNQNWNDIKNLISDFSFGIMENIQKSVIKSLQSSDNW